MFFLLSAGQEVRDRFSGAVEAFARRNASNYGHHGEHSKHKISDDAHITHKEAVTLSLFLFALIKACACFCCVCAWLSVVNLLIF